MTKTVMLPEAYAAHAGNQTAVEIVKAIRTGKLSALQVANACLEHIAQHEDGVKAWAFLEPELVRKQAQQADDRRASGHPLGPLHGVPVGIKDVIDTRDMPTEYGTALMSGHVPKQDATLVSLLREAGAIILGKTVTTELAFLNPNKTHNPHNTERTPGGSSSGSAAAVAAGMVPLAIGTQTVGSVIRPGAYCGVYAYKPTFGKISRHNVLPLSSELDTMGIFARSLADAALVADILISYDPQDPVMILASKPQLQTLLHENVPTKPRIAFVQSPVWNEAEETTKQAFYKVSQFLGEQVELVELPSAFDKAHQVVRTLMTTGFAINFDKLYTHNKEELSEHIIKPIEEGHNVSAVEYKRALQLVKELQVQLDELFASYDAILTPSAPGEAPDLSSTGNPVFCTIWTLCGTPALNLPLLKGPNGLPLGMQLVGQRDEDGRLFRTARWFESRLEDYKQ